MTCPSCNSPLEPNARFCGVCGYKVAPNRPPPSASSGPARQVPNARQQPPDARPRAASPMAASAGPGAQPAHAQAHAPARTQAKVRPKAADDIYIGQVLNNRFKVESKIG